MLVVGSGASGTQIADELLRAGRRVYLSVSRHRRVPRRFRGKDAYWWFDALGRFAQTIDSFPARQYPPSTVVTGVNGGYDVDVRKLAAAGAKVIGRVTGASDGELGVQANANQILDEADQAYAGFVAAARDFITRGGEDGLTEADPGEPEPLPGVQEVESLSLPAEGITTIVWATGTATTMARSGFRCSMPAAGQLSSAASPPFRACTSLGCTGCTRSSPGCSRVWATTPNSWPIGCLGGPPSP